MLSDRSPIFLFPLPARRRRFIANAGIHGVKSFVLYVLMEKRLCRRSDASSTLRYA